MNRFFIIVLLSVHLCATTEAGQLLKLPMLITHFMEHKENEVRTTIWNYLVHHYGGHEQDADWEDDMKLPFMQHQDVLHVNVVPPNPPLAFKKNAFTLLENKQFVFYKNLDIPSSYLNSIWQPPKHRA